MTDRGRKVKISLFLMIFSAVSMSFCSQAAILTTSEYDGAVVYNGHTYKVYQNGADYETAERECEERGGHLVTIADADTQNMVEICFPAFRRTIAGSD